MILNLLAKRRVRRQLEIRYATMYRVMGYVPDVADRKAREKVRAR